MPAVSLDISLVKKYAHQTGLYKHQESSIQQQTFMKSKKLAYGQFGEIIKISIFISRFLAPPDPLDH
jgi:hypothetical protein